MKQHEKKVHNLLNRLYQKRYLVDLIVAKAFEKVPLEPFLPRGLRRDAYKDKPLPFAKGIDGMWRPVAAPHMIVIYLQLLNLDVDTDVLQLGSMSGFFAALMSEIANRAKVYILEQDPMIAALTEHNLVESGYEKRVSVINKDPLEGLPEKAPFDRIVFAGAIPDIPPIIRNQKGQESIVLAPCGRKRQKLVRLLTIRGQEKLESHGQVKFISLPSKLSEEIKPAEIGMRKQAEAFFKETFLTREPMFKPGIEVPQPIMRDLQDGWALCEKGFCKAAIALSCVALEGTLRHLYERHVREEDRDEGYGTRWVISNYADKLRSINAISELEKNELVALHNLRNSVVHYKPETMRGIEHQAKAAVNLVKAFIEFSFSERS